MLQALCRRRRHATPDGGATPRQPLAEYNTADARNLFSHLLRRVRLGEQIVIAHAGRPVAKLVPYSGDEARRPGLLRAQLVVQDVAVLEGRRRPEPPSATPTRSWPAASR